MQKRGCTYQIPDQTNDGWQTASIENVGMDIGWMVGFLTADMAAHVFALVPINPAQLSWIVTL